MRKIYFVILILFLFQNLKAQDMTVLDKSMNGKKLWGGFDIGFVGIPLSSGGGFSDISSNVFYTWRLRAKAGYYIMPRISLGLGIGLTGEINTFPVFVNFHYLLSKNWYAYTDIGGIVANNAFSQTGFMSETGFGYRLHVWRRFAINAALGYNLTSYKSGNRFDIFSKSVYWRQTLAIRFGFEI
ncbi:MAG: hypothetical protein LBG92_08865 [Prevotellaceae bacterium]|nr:hypothetical protein [Prevotellaceae bacterium]